jgi:cellulose synthase/poly-beta-1,6-N-acetylglucosamine synthase-like glycosyltransferase
LRVLLFLLQGVGALLLLYCLAYNTLQILFVGIAFHEVRRRLRSQAYEDLDIVFGSPFTPPLSIIVPAFNEEKTIVETLNSLVRLKFPRMEIVVVNDGSTDGTLGKIVDHFGFRRMEITYEDRITTAPVRGFYDKRDGLPAGVIRWVVVDKENGGKADALNTGINASTCPFFLSMDADSIIDEEALLQAFRLMLEDERVVAIGGQVALVNGCAVRNGRVQSVGIPSSHLARFQVVEYIRSFSIGRTALGYLNSILIISGVFGIFRKDIVLKIGGYLTGSLTGKIAGEYVGASRETVCEDMEIIVRIQRYLQEKRLKMRVGYTPHPLCWTEAPESMSSLAKQRNRWTRGLIETLVYHREMFFNRRHGRIGWFAYPFFFFFEFLGAPIELLGYLGIPLMVALGLLSVEYLLLFLLVSVAYGTLVSVAAVITGVWSERASPLHPRGSSLLHYTRPGELAILLLYAFLENFGYRQLNLLWRVRGIWDYYFGKKGWEKFERIGFGGTSDARGGIG